MQPLKMALAGNPNSGKTTLFNALTGARRHVGNYPGITVEKHEIIMTVGDTTVCLVDLPGTYSLSPYSQEETVVRDFLTAEKPEVVIDVCNAGALERNLYLTVQLLELNLPVVLALNMMDEAIARGLKINTEMLSEKLGIPVVPCVGKTGEGVNDVVKKAIEFSNAKKEQASINLSYGSDIDPILAKMTSDIESANFLTNVYPAKWTALKFLEGDHVIQEMGTRVNSGFSAKLEHQVTTLAAHIKNTMDTSIEGVIADYRHGFITAILKDVVMREHDRDRQRQTTALLDSVLTNRLFGPIIMLGILWLTYYLTLTIGDIPAGWIGDLVGLLSDFATSVLPVGLLSSLIVSGIIDGVGSVIGFVPLIFMLFLIIAILDDTGYMARVAHMMDKVFRTFGLHGSSVMPYIISGGIPGGCAIPGIMATRTLRSPRERLATILTASFLSCGAKVPVFLLFTSVFFPVNQQTSILFGLTLVGWAFALLVALALRSTLIKGESTPFVLELPPYRLPTLNGIFIHAWERAYMYLKKAGSVILAVSIVLWAAMTFPSLPLDQVAIFDNQRTQIEQSVLIDADKEKQLSMLDGAKAEAGLKHSVAGKIGIFLEPVGALAGFDWRSNIALIAGIVAKEVVVSTLGTAYSISDVDPETADQTLGQRLKNDSAWNSARAMSVMLFVMLYSPCFITVVVIWQETQSWRWALFSVVANTILAYIVAVSVYQVMSKYLS